MTYQDRLQEYRASTFCTDPKHRVKSKDEAVRFVNERGYIFFWPIQGVALPSLWTAVAGDRPVPDEHDDPGHITWEWKDSLLGKHVWYYGKILRKKGTIISMALVPYFYALTENYGSPEEDYLTLYEQGRMTQESKAVYEALLEHGPLDTIILRKTAHLTGTESEARFSRALADLQANFMIMPVGITDSGSWHYSYAYDVVARYEPSLVDAARYIGEIDARQKILELYFRSVGAAQQRDIVKLLGWRPGEIEQVVERLIIAGLVIDHQDKADGQPGNWIVLNELL